MRYSHSYIDKETGNVIDVYDDDHEPIDPYRNAGPEVRRRGRGFREVIEHAQVGIPRPRPRPGHRPPRSPGQQPIVREPYDRPMPVPRPPVQDGGFSIDKSIVADVVPTVGKVWASFLLPPDMPPATGDDIADRDNASMHRQALTEHQQNQTRILALTELAGRVIKMVL